MYRAYDVFVRKEDCEKANAILEKHYCMGEIDDLTYGVETRDGEETVRYHIHPYVYEDLEVIINELKQNSIQVL